MKRTENFKFSYNTNVKRQKIQDAEDIWGDDPEIDEVDRCIDLATQICSQSQQNVNTNISLACYDDFKQKPNIFSSTQAFCQPPVASTSKNTNIPLQVNNLNSSCLSINTIITKDATDQEISKLMLKIQTLESQKKKLVEVYESKHGEIAILRSQLKQAQNSIDNEKIEKLRIAQENQQKWDAKFNTTKKDLDSLKCELELKNLEVANLRDKLAELKKVYNSNLNISILNEELNTNHADLIKRKNNTSTGYEPKICKNIQTDDEVVIYTNKNPIIYPLQQLLLPSLFEKCETRKSVAKIYNDSSSTYRHNFSTSQCAGNANSVSEIENNENFYIHSIYPELLTLLKCTLEEINNSENIITSVCKIINYSRRCILILLIKLHKLRQNFQYDDLENMNNLYLEQNNVKYQSDCVFSGVLWNDIEVEIDTRRYISVISALCIHSNIVFRYLIGQSCDQLNIDYYSECSKYLNDNILKLDHFKNSDHEFLNILLQLTTIIKEIRISEQFCGFLASVLKLLSSLLHKESLSAECYNLIFQIFRQIVFSRPNNPVMKYVCEFLKHMSRHYSLVVLLCSQRKLNNAHYNIKDGLLHFSEDICTFRLLATEIEACSLSTEMACEVMQFLENAVTCNVSWMYHQEEPRCECLVEVYSLAIDIMYNSVERYSFEISDVMETQLFHSIFYVGLIFLNILTIRIPDLIVRCSRLYSQYQTIIKYINSVKDKLYLNKSHETALENLISQLNYDVQKECEITMENNIEDIFECNFTSF